ncbi:MAG: hypothetical protein Q8P24_00795 [Desulfobacterales bacterium]|nr:hypothetical protein [Desulfobacterales bacterium]
MGDKEFYTMTLGKVYASQGYFDKAVQVYQHLLEADPGRQDVIEALSEAREKLLRRQAEAGKDLPVLFARWIDLALGYQRLRKLKKLQKHFFSQQYPGRTFRPGS